MLAHHQPRAGSARAPHELRCQAATCSALISSRPLPDAWDDVSQLLSNLGLALPAASLAAFRACHEQRDTISFIVLLSELMVELPGWPYCESCAERLVHRLNKDADDAGERQDRALRELACLADAPPLVRGVDGRRLRIVERRTGGVAAGEAVGESRLERRLGVAPDRPLRARELKARQLRGS
jgi:hypothetical protein